MFLFNLIFKICCNMKKVVLNHLVIAALAVAAAFTSCGGGSGSSGSGGGKSSGKIKMTTERGGDFSFNLTGSGVATVDWGDGSEKVSLTLNENEVRFSHEYPNASIRTITINGDNITGMQCSWITSLDVSRCTEMTKLGVNQSEFKNLDISKNTALTKLSFSSVRIASLDVRKNTSLTSLSCSDITLTSLDVSNNTALTDLYLKDLRSLTSLDVSGATALTTLSVWRSFLLTSLDVSKNTALILLEVQEVPLKSLDVSENTALTWLRVPITTLTTSALNDLFGTLHSNAGEKKIDINGNPGSKDCDRSIALRKGWTFPY